MKKKIEFQKEVIIDIKTPISDKFFYIKKDRNLFLLIKVDGINEWGFYPFMNNAPAVKIINGDTSIDAVKNAVRNGFEVFYCNSLYELMCEEFDCPDSLKNRLAEQKEMVNDKIDAIYELALGLTTTKPITDYTEKRKFIGTTLCFDLHETSIILNSKNFGGKVTSAESILKFIKYKTITAGGVSFKDINRFCVYLSGGKTWDARRDRGHYCTNLYGSNKDGLLYKWCFKNSQGRWNIKPDTEIKAPFYSNKK